MPRNVAKVALLLWKEQNTEGLVVIGGGWRDCDAEWALTDCQHWQFRALSADSHILSSQPLCELGPHCTRRRDCRVSFPETYSQDASAGLRALGVVRSPPLSCVTTVCSQCRWCSGCSLWISFNGTMRTLGPRVLIWPFKEVINALMGSLVSSKIIIPSRIP